MFWIIKNQVLSSMIYFLSLVDYATPGITAVTALSGDQARIPCDITFVGEVTNATLILWYKSGSRHPLYSVDGRDGDVFLVEHIVPDNLKEKLSFDLSIRPPVLKIFNVNQEDTGLYNCRVDYKRSRTVYYRSTLVVVDPPGRPIIKDKFGEVVPNVAGPYNEGEPLALICESEGGKPLPRLRWYQGLDIIDDTDRILPGGVVRNELLIASLEKSFLNKMLTCEARNSNLTEGQRTSISLNINLKPTDVTMAKLGVLISGLSYNILCNTTGARPRASITWSIGTQKLDDIQVTNNDGIVSSSLKFVPSSSDHGRVLTCRAHNPSISSSDVEDSQLLQVHYVPDVRLSYEVQEDSANLGITEGEDVFLHCMISANPRIITLSWIFNRTILKTDSVAEKVENLTYLLKNVTHRNSGHYACQAKNSIGKSRSKEISLKIKYSPICSRSIRVTKISHDLKTIEVTCEVNADPSRVKFHWWLEKLTNAGKMIITSSSSSSTISIASISRSVLLEHDRIYCRAENSIGRQKEPCVLKINPGEPPNAPTNCTVMQPHSQQLYVACNLNENIGIKQMYHMEVYKSDTMVLLKNVTSIVPYLNASGIPSKTKLRLILYNANAIGRSKSTTMQVTSTAKNIGSRRKNGIADEKPIAAILTGMLTGIFVVLCAILVVIKLRHQCGICAKDANSSNTSSRKTEKNSPEEMCHSKDGQSPDLIPLHKTLVRDEKPIFIIDSEHSMKNEVDVNHVKMDLDRYGEAVRKKAEGQETYLIAELTDEAYIVNQSYGHCCGVVEKTLKPDDNDILLTVGLDCNNASGLNNTYQVNCNNSNTSPNSKRYKLESSV